MRTYSSTQLCGLFLIINQINQFVLDFLPDFESGNCMLLKLSANIISKIKIVNMPTNPKTLTNDVSVLVSGAKLNRMFIMPRSTNIVLISNPMLLILQTRLHLYFHDCLTKKISATTKNIQKPTVNKMVNILKKLSIFTLGISIFPHLSFSVHFSCYLDQQKYLARILQMIFQTFLDHMSYQDIL